MKVGSVSNSNFTVPHAHRPVRFFVIASSFLTRGLSVLAIPLTGGTSALIRPGPLKLHTDPDNFSRSSRTSDVAVCCSRAFANSRTRTLLALANRQGSRLPGALLHFGLVCLRCCVFAGVSTYCATPSRVALRASTL